VTLGEKKRITHVLRLAEKRAPEQEALLDGWLLKR
jgi:hypothetical protein